MINKDLIYEHSLKNLSSFYRDYMVDDSLLKTLTIAYMRSLDMLTNYANDVFNNQFVKTAEATRQFPYITFDAVDSIYTLTRIARTPRINFYLGVPSSYTEGEIMEYWRHEASPEVKISILDMMGIYTELVSGDYLRAMLEGESEERYKGRVIKADVYHKTVSKRSNIDYAIKDNKFFILNLHEFDTENPTITMKNITLDYNMSWLRTGSYMGVKYSDVVGKIEYNNLSKMFLQIAAHGPLLNAMKYSIEEMFPTEQIKVVDCFSRENEKSHYWETAMSPEEADAFQLIKRAIANKFNSGELLVGQGLDNPDDNIEEGGKGLSVFDFALCMPKTMAPPSIFEKDSKIDMFKRYLDIIKPADSYYFISWTEETADTVEPRDYQELTADSMDDMLDTIDCKDSQVLESTELHCDRVVSTDYATMLDYSSGIHADDEVIYLDMEHHDMSSSEESRLIEHVSIMYNTFPEAPIGVVANYMNGEVHVGFQNSGTGATYYEIFRNDTLISKIPISSTNRYERLCITDKRFSNIKTDKYKVRTVYLKENRQVEEAEYSHFSVVSITS